MRILTLAGSLALCSWLATSASAQVRDGARIIGPESASGRVTANRDVQPGSKQSTPQVTPPTSTGAAENSSEAWRFVNYNGQWWYYLPSKQWLVWNGGRWVTPTESARQANVAPQPRRTGYRGADIYYPGPAMQQAQPAQDPFLGRPIYRRFFNHMPFVPFTEDPTTSQPVTGAGQR